jgi:hypothetical protein
MNTKFLLFALVLLVAALAARAESPADALGVCPAASNAVLPGALPEFTVQPSPLEQFDASTRSHIETLRRAALADPIRLPEGSTVQVEAAAGSGATAVLARYAAEDLAAVLGSVLRGERASASL